MTFRHWSGVSPYTSSFEFAGTCVFGKQSAGKRLLRPLLSRAKARHIPKLRLAFLPSSLTRNHPFTLGYSPCPPVSVCGTDSIFLARKGFSWKIFGLSWPGLSQTFHSPLLIMFAIPVQNRFTVCQNLASAKLNAFPVNNLKPLFKHNKER